MKRIPLYQCVKCGGQMVDQNEVGYLLLKCPECGETKTRTD